MPFFGWAIFLLRRRFLYYEESTLALEMATSVFVGLVFWIETIVLKEALGGQVLLYIAAILGLSIAGFSLYAHVFISLISRLVVDIIAPGEDSALDHPRFGPVEALERAGDYEGALQEYLVLARIYPRNFEVLSRAARVQHALGNLVDAEAWYLRARKRAKRADDALEAANQLCRIYDDDLSQPEKADYQLARFIQDFPDSPDVSIVRDRLNRRANKTDWSVSDFLDALEDDPLSPYDTPSDAAARELEEEAARSRPRVELVTLEAAGASDKDSQAADVEKELEVERPRATSQSVQLTPLSEMPKEAKKVIPETSTSTVNGKGKSKSKKSPSQLEALEKLGPQKRTEEAAPPPKRSSISLDPMENK